MRLGSPQTIAQLLLISALLAAGLWTLHSFFPALVWAAILAIAVWPVLERLQYRQSGLARITVPLLLTLAVGLIFLAPLLMVALRASSETRELLRWLHEMEATGAPVP